MNASDSVRAMSLPSGLSALIQAATSQLGHLENDTATLSNKTVEPDPYSGVTTDDAASSDGGEKLEDSAKHTQTPVIVPEPDPLRHTFPELLMTLASDQRKNETIAFLPDGKFFAIRVKDFTDGLMKEYFPVTAFDEFLDLVNEWGFTRLVQDANETGIEIFRHPHFIKGDFLRCKGIKYGENPTNARVSALPEAAKLEYTISEESCGSPANVKRRLSPGFIKRRESESSGNMKRLHSADDQIQTVPNVGSENEGNGPFSNQNRADEIRSIALAVTTEKLSLHQESNISSTEASSKNLVDEAVKSATHTIVTDAIETLLNDEVHTKETYLKHEKELSKSSLPGVVPISKVLFDAEKKETVETKETPPPRPLRRRSSGFEQLSIAATIRAEELREESERELRKATGSTSMEQAPVLPDEKAPF